jgi:hypothetical protein
MSYANPIPFWLQLQPTIYSACLVLKSNTNVLLVYYYSIYIRLEINFLFINFKAYNIIKEVGKHCYTKSACCLICRYKIRCRAKGGRKAD